ncbi:DUF4189 domain-containing protein [Nocardia sp. NPDC058176]|uniref:DUF4189 domain-containing protein n=1 Tax=Nocardia sp. NPDC058176 TaxID=3346368 RepID=UPI0036D93605
MLTSAAVLTATVGSLLAVHVTPAQAQARNYYGAISVSVRAGHSTISTNYGSFAEAESASLNSCRTNGGGGGCEVKLSWRNGCGAIAISRGWWSYGSGASIGAAKRSALDANPGAASIKHWKCTSGYSL